MTGRARYIVVITVICMVCTAALSTTAKGGNDTGGNSRSDSSSTAKQMIAYRINPHPPEMDGVLDDPVWENATWVKDFTQKRPHEGEPPANKTEVAIIYDDEALYVGARMYSADPSAILGNVSRRDNPGNSERIIVSFDTYRDLRTAYTFSVTVAGTRVDAYHPTDNEGGADHDWDPVWTAKTARTEYGWTAEMKIPFTQLRFNNRDVQVWGVNLNRWVPSSNEDSFWIVVPTNESGWSSRMGELRGITGIRPSRRIEFLPYVSSEALISEQVDPANPFNDGRTANLRVGGDFKMGVGPNLTLEGTINPDFGQVEADPAVVNLSAFEIFFPERRPFFTEGSQLLAGGGHNYFYSRRIGANPSGYPEGDYVDVPGNTSILGAAKLTGRTGGGLNVGLLGAITSREKARAHDSASGVTTEETVEPAAGWGVARMQQEVFGNGSWVGVVATAVERDLEPGSDLDSFLRRRAYSGGADWQFRFGGGKYVLLGNVGGSHITGSAGAIESAQRSSARYFQRPDADYVQLDPTRTSLTGWTASTRFEKNEGAWLWSASAAAESPEFEINDLGSLGTADDIDASAGVRYRQTTPASFYHDYWVGTWVGTGWNFGGTRQYSFVDFESGLTFSNFYGVWMSAEYFPGAQSDNLTRGGPSMGTATSWNFDLNFWNSSRGRTSWWAYGNYQGDELGGERYVGEAGVTVRPGSRWQVSLTPRYTYTLNPRQYVGTFDGTGRPETFGNRYVFAFIDRSEIASTMRLNYSFTPNFTLEAYLEPFAASGSYSRHGELLAAQSKDLLTYGTGGTTITREEDGSYTVADGADSFAIDNRDFNVVSFRSNLVLRWEWNPGSTLFLVWQQNSSGFDQRGESVGLGDLGDALSATGDNFFALKITYWIPFS